VHTSEAPGTIIIDISERFLYLIQPNNRAWRYGIEWQGLLKISCKAEWPDWTPPAEMIERQPYLPRFMAGGPGNPMGARALYLGNTVYQYPRHQRAGNDRACGVVRLLPAGERRSSISIRVPVGTKVIVQQ
jgi:lipoprotein-anchoring transpeptidase ErfK/SrfK